MKDKKPSARELTFRRQKAIRQMQKQVNAGTLTGDRLREAKDLARKSADAIKAQAAEEATAKTVIQGVTEKIDTKQIAKVKSIPQFRKKLMQRLGRALPGVAGAAVGLGSFLASPSEAAAFDTLGIGSTGGDAEARAIEDPSSPEFKARMRMMKKRKKR